MRENSVITRTSNDLHESLRRGLCGIKYDAGSICHQVDVRGYNAGGSLKSILNMMLAGCTRHPDDWERERFCCGGGHLADHCSNLELNPAFARAAMAASTGSLSAEDFNRAAPIRTSCTSTPSVVFSAWVTRLTQEPQCIPSMCSTNSAIMFLLLALMILAFIRCMPART